jgi:hypothetical protein
MKWLLLLTTVLLSVEAYGVAFCALRDPGKIKDHSELPQLNTIRGH